MGTPSSTAMSPRAASSRAMCSTAPPGSITPSRHRPRATLAPLGSTTPSTPRRAVRHVTAGSTPPARHPQYTRRRFASRPAAQESTVWPMCQPVLALATGVLSGSIVVSLTPAAPFVRAQTLSSTMDLPVSAAALPGSTRRPITCASNAPVASFQLPLVYRSVVLALLAQKHR